ncbi:MAG: c-type cytochrome [Gemmataceae bacterium]|nr:c-type cytochrome [Gemmataceae bacterium]
MTRSGRSPATAASGAFVLALALQALFIAGCDETYDPELLYPIRRDWIVNAESLEGTPGRINPPGILPLQILDGRKELLGISSDFLKARDEGKIVDPRPVVDVGATGVELMRSLRDLAGRPRYPKIDVDDESLNERLATELKLDRKTLERGSVVYRRNCLHCHGLSGDGKGPTGLWVNPHPRDFRSGIFKYVSSSQDEGKRKPLRDDLRRVLINGIEGTAMPSFSLLSDEDMDAVISYVIHLSIRGEAEMETLKELILERSQASTEEGEAEPIVERVRGKGRTAAERWLEAQTSQLTPPSQPDYEGDEAKMLEAAARGYKFFTRADQCAQCHTNFGRDADLRYDMWGTMVRPRNLTANIYGGGRRPIDFYWRIHLGIRGSGMPSFAPVNEKDPSVKDAETRERTMWDVVAFIRLLPYPEYRAKLSKAHGIYLD